MMMQRDPSQISLENTFRDSNEIPTTPQEFVLPSAPSIGQMDFNFESRHSIIRPVETDNSLSPRINAPDRSRITNKPLVRSIIRSNENDDERPSQEQAEQLRNETLINENNSLSEAAGFDPIRLAEIDADSEYALQLQQEEYERESSMPNHRRYLPFQVEPDGESATANPPFFYEPDTPFTNDQQLAAYLQEQENRNGHRRPPFPFFPIRQRSTPAPTQTAETDEPENELIPPIRHPLQQHLYNEDDDDDDENPPSNNAQAFLQFLASQGHNLPEGFPALLAGVRRGHRRTGNLQDTEDDFGPEDYERLLQLDDAVHKKKLNKDQINSIPQVKFQRSSNNNDEENKCGVCLEFFEENQILRRFPCNHVYHKECGDRWLQENNVCPICREPPVQQQSTSNSRYHRGVGGSRRPPNHNNRNSSNRNTNNPNNTNTHHPNNNRRGTAPHRQS